MRGIKKFVAQSALVLASFFAFGIIFAASANAATFTVTNTNDSGAGSLREAINDANGNGNPATMDVIEFNIAGDQVHTINVLSDLPSVTQKVTIDGYTQPGAQENTAVSPNPINSVIKIELAGTNGTFTQGILGLIADDSIVRGLAIFDGVTPSPNFDKANVGLVGVNNSIEGSYVGVRADGITIGTYDRNCTGVGAAGTDAKIGGATPAARNVLSAKCSIAQSATVTAYDGTIIYGNYIGIGKDGITDLTPEAADSNGLAAPFTIGINLLGDETTGSSAVGGSQLGQANLLTGNTLGISISSPGNTIQGNLFGTDYSGQVRDTITNGLGIVSIAGTNSLVGGTGAGEGNIFAGLKGAGIEIASMTIVPISYNLVPSKIAVLGNRIYAISPFDFLGIGNSNLGIDLASWTDTTGDFAPDEFTNRGPTENDTGDVDTGPNNFINSPVLKSARQVGDQLTIAYDLDVADSPSNSYRVEFFANDESTIFGSGPGETYLGSVTVSPGSNLNSTLTVVGDLTNKALSATATAIDNTTPSGFGSTSEFSQNVEIGSSVDADADGISDTEEDGAPNNGDGNEDGIADKLQPTVSSFVDVNGDHYITFAVTGCRENSNVAVMEFAALNVRDNGYQYPFGLTDFTLNCSRGDTASISMYTFSDEGVNGFKARKFRNPTNSFVTIDSALLTEEEIGGEKAIKLEYSITDGGPFDDDGQENGLIVDPVGLAGTTLTATLLPETGLPYWFLPIPLALLFTAIYVVYDWQRHRKPLIEQDPNVHYTIWHHLRVVTIPVFKYRISFVVSKPSPDSGQTPAK